MVSFTQYCSKVETESRVPPTFTPEPTLLEKKRHNTGQQANGDSEFERSYPVYDFPGVMATISGVISNHFRSDQRSNAGHKIDSG